MLKTRNIYIDTEVFVSNNFFHGKNLQRLARYGNLQTIYIFITEITKYEIQNNIKENLLNAQNEINKLRQLMSNKGRILKNIDAFKPYLELPKLDLGVNFDQLSQDLDNFILNGKIQSIPHSNADINDVVKKYFDQSPPFGSGKKYEFPDAIVLSAIENWCTKNRTKIYVISNDPDFKNFVSSNIIVISSVKIMLDKIINQYNADEIEWVNEIFQIHEEEIVNKINEAFIEKLIDEISFDINISDVNVLNISLHDKSLVEDNKHYEFIFQLDFTINFTADVTYDDYSHSVYDKEDDKYYFYESQTRTIEVETTQTTEISIEAYFEDGDKPADADVNINCIYVSIPEDDLITDELDGYMFTF